ncbi:MAG: hypothetical protein CMM15_13450 [Rhodospirillaceae bacterium]|nr:hypothetical protein [Rhodospirillaceae bacterium]
MSRNYKKSINFCPELNQAEKSPFNADNPLTYCLFPTLGSQFTHGSSSSNLLYGTYNPSCQNFMAEYCSKDWNKFCDTYEILNTDKSKPNNAARDPENFTYAQRFLKNNEPTLGEMLIRNTVSLRFIDFPFIGKRQEPFDSSISGSPTITIYENKNVGPSVIKPISNINDNVFIHKMLHNQKACFDVIARLYAGFVNGEANTHNFRNSILEKFFVENQNVLNYFLNYPEKTLDKIKDSHETYKTNKTTKHNLKDFYVGFQIQDTKNEFSVLTKGNIGTIPLYPCSEVGQTTPYFKKLCDPDHVKLVTYMDKGTAEDFIKNKEKISIYDGGNIYTASLPEKLPKRNTIIVYKNSDFAKV